MLLSSFKGHIAKFFLQWTRVWGIPTKGVDKAPSDAADYTPQKGIKVMSPVNLKQHSKERRGKEGKGVKETEKKSSFYCCTIAAVLYCIVVVCISNASILQRCSRSARFGLCNVRKAPRQYVWRMVVKFYMRVLCNAEQRLTLLPHLEWVGVLR